MDEHSVPTSGKVGPLSASRWGERVATPSGNDFHNLVGSAEEAGIEGKFPRLESLK